MIEYKEFKKIYDTLSGEPEFEIKFKNNENKYMIIKYKNYVSFQRCGIKNGSGEYKCLDLDHLYNSELIDKIVLKENWNLIEDIVIDEIYSIVNNKEEINEYLKFITIKQKDVKK